MAELGKFFVVIGSKFDDKGLKKARESVNQAGKYFLGFGAVATAALLAVTNKASKLEETTAKFMTVFRGMEDEAMQWSKELVKSYGVSTEQSKRFLGSIQDLLVPMGMQRDLAGKLSNEIVKLSVDLASFNNMPTERVMLDIQSALVGNFETMKKYGVVLNATKVEQEIMNQGWATSTDEITQTMKAQAAYNLIVNGSTDAIGDFNRTSKSYANQVKIMRARIDDLLAKIGDDFMPVMKEVVKLINEKAIPYFERWREEISKTGVASEGLIKILKGIVTVTLGIVSASDLVALTYKMLKISFENMWKDNRIILKEAIEELKNKTEEYAEFFEMIKNFEVDITEDTEKKKVSVVSKGAQKRQEITKKEEEERRKAAMKTAREIRRIENDLVNIIVRNYATLRGTLTAFKNYVINSVIKVIATEMIKAIGIAKALKIAIATIAGGPIGFIKSIIGFQEGGMLTEPVIGRGVRTGTAYSFAERGPEMITPVGKGFGGQIVTHIENNITGGLGEEDIEDTLTKITEATKRGVSEAVEMAKTLSSKAIEYSEES